MNFSKHKDIFIKEMERLKFSENTVKNYIANLHVFFEYFKEKEHPLHLNEADIKEFLGQFTENNTQRSYHGAIKKFYTICLKQPNKFKYIKYCHKSDKHPIILSHEEIQKLIDAAGNLKHKTIIITTYSTGVRVSELLNIKLCDIDRSNKVIHIMNGKGAKQRQATMKPELLELFAKYYREFKPKEYLFEGAKIGEKYTQGSINQFLKKYAKIAGITKKVNIHLLRHNYATHSLEAGENLYVTQKALGHSSPKTTADVYYHISPHIIANAYSPINNIRI